MNKQELINFFEQCHKENLEMGTEKIFDSVIPDFFKQQLLAKTVKSIIKELKIENFFFHATALSNAISIYKDEFIIPRKMYARDAIMNNFGLYHEAHIITDGTPENVVMSKNIIDTLVVIDKLKKTGGDTEKIKEYERRVHVLSQLIDLNHKIYFHDLPDFTFKWDSGSINLSDHGSMLFCIDPTKVNYRKKCFYFNYFEDGEVEGDNSIAYYLDEYSETYIQDYVKANAYYQSYEYVTYDAIPIEDISYMIVFNKNGEIHTISNNGNASYELLKELTYEGTDISN